MYGHFLFLKNILMFSYISVLNILNGLDISLCGYSSYITFLFCLYKPALNLFICKYLSEYPILF